MKKTKIKITINEKEIEVKKLALGKYGALLEALDSLPKEVTKEITTLDKKSTEDFIARLPMLLGKSWDSLIEVLAIASGLDNKYLAEECDLVDGANLLKAMLEVNDFLEVKNALVVMFKKGQSEIKTGSGE